MWLPQGDPGKDVGHFAINAVVLCSELGESVSIASASFWA